MGILEFIIITIVLGVLIWLAVTYIPMPEVFKKIVVIGPAIVLIIWLLYMLLGEGRSMDIHL